MRLAEACTAGLGAGGALPPSDLATLTSCVTCGLMHRLGRISEQITVPVLEAVPAAAAGFRPVRGKRPVPTAGASLGCDVGILTEATGDHLGGFLGGLATAPSVRSVSVADITDGAQFVTVRKALPEQRMGGEYTSVQAMLSARKPALTLVTAEAQNSAYVASCKRLRKWLGCGRA